MNIISEAAAHSIVDDLHDININKSKVFFAGSFDIDRHNHPYWIQCSNSHPNSVIQITTQDKDTFSLIFQGDNKTIDLIDRSSIVSILGQSSNIILDVTDIRTSTWVPIFQAALSIKANVKVIYSEPKSYNQNLQKDSWNWMNLTDRTEEFGPIPGLAKLQPYSEIENSVVVLLLGFDGVRARQALSIFDPTPSVIPIIGVPGYSIEYPCTSVYSNHRLIRETQNIDTFLFSGAADPFHTRRNLRSIRSSYPDKFIHIAAVGTKPHQIAAVLFRLEDDNTDIMYDFPRPSNSSTSGVLVSHIYNLAIGGKIVGSN